MSTTDDIREKIGKETTSEKKMALLCVTLIAMVAILKLFLSAPARRLEN